MRMLVDGYSARVHNGPLIGIARTELLAVLDRHAGAAGVELHYGERRRLADLDADLVIVADGVNSQTRTEHAAAFGADVDVARGPYLWASADFAPETAIRGNAVLLGDAAHTAHYSVGSGTKLAMEDAIALRDAVAAAPDLPSALATYERERRPQVERIQDLARRSRRWWDSFPRRTHLPVDQLMLAYMTRTGNVGLERFPGTNPDTVRRGLAQFAGVPAAQVPVEGLAEWILGRPLGHGTRILPPGERDRLSTPAPELAEPPTGADLARVAVTVDDLWSVEADHLVKQLHDLALAAWRGSWLTGPSDRASLLDRLDLGERLRSETAGLVVVDGPPTCLDDLPAGVAAGRIDLVSTSEDRS